MPERGGGMNAKGRGIPVTDPVACEQNKSEGVKSMG